MIKYLCLLLIFSPSMVFAKKKSGYNRIYPAFCTQYYIDQYSIKYRDLQTNVPSNAKNTIGYYLGLQYERVTRYGLILNFGLQYGVRQYDIFISQDVSNYDSNAVIDLMDRTYTNKTKTSLSYWGFRLLAGYKTMINKNVAFVAKGGVAAKLFNNKSVEKKRLFLDYKDDNGITFHSAQIGTQIKNLGKKNIYSFELYLGFEKEINGPIVKNISIGIEAGRNWWLWLTDGVMKVDLRPSVSSSNSSKIDFYDRNLSLGLLISVGLWK